MIFRELVEGEGFYYSKLNFLTDILYRVRFEGNVIFNIYFNFFLRNYIILYVIDIYLFDNI